MQEKKQRKSIGQCKCCGLHFFDDINKEQLCESCSRFISDYTKQVRKEVVRELKDKMLYCSERFADCSHYYNGKELDEVIDQIATTE